MFQLKQKNTTDARRKIQPKLKIGQPGDKYEQEADTVADSVMNATSADQVQMQPVEEEEEMMQPKLRMQPEDEEEPVQMNPSSESSENIGYASATVVGKLNRSKSSGNVLPEDTSSDFGTKMGADFSSVRIHTDSNAVQMNQELGAKAFTHGSDIYFNVGNYQPESREGKHLLAHELTHVVQQGKGGDKQIQRTIGDGHDLGSPRFATDTTLQDIYDGSGTLKNGDENESVRKVQHAIHDSGIRFSGIGIDGKFGNLTERRVTRFQNRNLVTEDPSGEVGDATLEKLDQLFPATAMPADATAAFSFPVMLQILCAWNSAMIRDLRNLSVHLVADLEWADERFDGATWVPDPTPGEGETDGLAIYIATDNTNENVAKALYHEYQHARAPYVFRSRSWAEEESYAFRVETDWAIARGITPDPSLTTTNPVTGDVETDPAGVASTVTSYPGLDAANPGEVIGKVGTNRVRVRMPDGRVTVRNAVENETVAGPRRITRPHRIVQGREWRC